MKKQLSSDSLPAGRPPLYPWQEKCLKRWFENQCRGIVQAATGTGKTRLALEAAARLDEAEDRRLLVKIVVPTSALMRQWKQAIQSFFEPDESAGLYSRDNGGGQGSASGRPPKGHSEIRSQIGLRGGGSGTETGRKYMIYVINSARYELARQILADLGNGFPVLLIADECHRYESGQNRLIFEFLPHIARYKDHFFSLGLTATLPSGSSQSYLASVLGRNIYSYGISQASASQNVCPYDIFQVGLSFEPEEMDEYQELTDRMRILYNRLSSLCPMLRHTNLKEKFELLRDLSRDKDPRTAQAAALYMNLAYRRKKVTCLASARILCACDLVGRLPDTEKILIFTERVCQAEELYSRLSRRYPGKAGRFHSQMGELANRNTLNRFRDGELRILISCRSLDEGVDVPDASTGIILSGSAVQRQRIQRLGRIIRLSEGKERASLYYFYVEESAEESLFLPDTGSCRVLDLYYLSEIRAFANSRYDDAAAAFLADLWDRNISADKAEEIERCLRLGAVRADWLARRDYIKKKIRDADNVRDRNYWICMERISLFYRRFAADR